MTRHVNEFMGKLAQVSRPKPPARANRPEPALRAARIALARITCWFAAPSSVSPLGIRVANHRIAQSASAGSHNFKGLIAMGTKRACLLGYFAPEAPLRSALTFPFLALGRQENLPVGGASRVLNHDFTGTSNHG